MGKMPRLTALAAFFVLTGCANFPRDAQSTGSISYEALIRQIKFDVGTYMLAHQSDVPVVEEPDNNADEIERSSYKNNQQAGLARPSAPNEKCLGQVSFDISTVRVTTTAEVENKAEMSAGLQVPLNLTTINLNGGATIARKGSLTTTLEIFPTSGRIEEKPRPVAEFRGTPIADTLEALRHDLINTADTQPCFDFGVSTEQKSNTVKWGFTVTRSLASGGKLAVILFSLGAEGTSSSTVANTIEVTFIGVGGFG